MTVLKHPLLLILCVEDQEKNYYGDGRVYTAKLLYRCNG